MAQAVKVGIAAVAMGLLLFGCNGSWVKPEVIPADYEYVNIGVLVRKTAIKAFHESGKWPLGKHDLFPGDMLPALTRSQSQGKVPLRRISEIEISRKDAPDGKSRTYSVSIDSEIIDILIKDENEDVRSGKPNEPGNRQ